MSVTGLRRSSDTPGTHHGMPKEKSSKDVKKWAQERGAGPDRQRHVPVRA